MYKSVFFRMESRSRSRCVAGKRDEKMRGDEDGVARGREVVLPGAVVPGIHNPLRWRTQVPIKLKDDRRSQL